MSENETLVEEKVEEGIEEEVEEVAEVENVELAEETVEDLVDGVKRPKAPTLTLEDRDRMQKAFNYWHTHGYPEKASVLWECLEQDRRPPANLIPSDNDIKPETAIDPSTLEIPPYAGPNATKEVWREFAKQTLDMDKTIIDTLERKDLIQLLQSKNVIPKEDPRATNQHTK